MAKIVLDPVTNGATLSTLNANFDKIEAEFQNRVAYRDNVSGETNTIRNDMDHDGNDVFNVGTLATNELLVDGVPVDGGDVASIPQLRADVIVLQNDMNVAQADIINNATIESINNSASLRTSGSPINPVEDVSTRANKFLAFDPVGQPISSFGTGADVGLRSDLGATSGSQIIGFIQGGTGSTVRTLQDKTREFVSVKDFGAVGDGIVDDTAAIEAAWLYITDPLVDRWPAAIGDFAFNVTKGPRLYFPTGNYVYNGTGLTLNVGQSWIFEFEGDGQFATRITLGSGVFFVNSANNPTGMRVNGIHFEGGAGALLFTSTAGNVGRDSIVEGCTFSNYTVCAIASSSQDWPNFKIRRNTFAGASGSNTIGLAVSGYTANSGIEENAFLRNRYHIKLASTLVGGLDKGPPVPINIWRNDFLRIDTSLTNTYDIWIKPNPDTGNNAGRAALFLGNKFGNENLQSGDARILIADEGAGTTVADKHHATSVSSGYVSGVAFLKNNVNNNNLVHPFIFSYTPKIHNFDLNDIYDNGSPTYICEYSSSIVATTFESQCNTNRASLQQSLSCAEGDLAPIASNVPGTWSLYDPLGYSSDDTQFPNVTGGDGFGAYVNLLTPTSTANFTVADGSKASINNSVGEINEASEITATSSSGRFVGALTFASIEEGRLVFIEGELAQGSTNSVTAVRIEITDNSGRVVLRRIYRLNPNWTKFRIPYNVNKSGITSLSIRAQVFDFSVGVLEKFRIGSVAIYHGQEPINRGFLRSLGSNWDRQHLILGAYHLWVDTTGILRIKSGAPVSNTDGTIVGTQT